MYIYLENQQKVMGTVTWDRLSHSPTCLSFLKKQCNAIKTLQICQKTVSYFKYISNERQFLYNYMYKHFDNDIIIDIFFVANFYSQTFELDLIITFIS